jgi:YVTN family beta-propeller protein
VVVANTGSDDASIIDAKTMQEVARVRTGREPYGVAATPDGKHALIASRLAETPRSDESPSAELTVIDAARTRVLKRLPLESAHLSESVAFETNRGWILTPLVRVRNLVPITQVARGWVMSSGLAIARQDDDEVTQVPLDEANAYYADPAGLVVHPAGHRAYLASGGSDTVTVIDLEKLSEWLGRADALARRRAIHNLELSHDYVVARIPTGRNPSRLVLSPDGDTLYVGERLVDSILMIDTRNNQPLGRIQLGDGGSDDPIRRGERMFTTATKTFQGQFSCRSCHPGGHVDGLTYDFDGDGIGDNMLDNRSLQGLAGTWPFKWNGKNPSLKVQCGPRFAKVLMRTDPFTDDELRDLVAFLESMPPARTRSAHQTEPTPSEERGREIFFATQTPDGQDIPRERQCRHCHAPPLYTSRMKTNVGTRAPTDATGEFDTPHLLGIGASAPYLHDGRARSLEELWTIYQTNDLHGVSSYMNKHQLNDLVEFLKTL